MKNSKRLKLRIAAEPVASVMNATNVNATAESSVVNVASVVDTAATTIMTVALNPDLIPPMNETMGMTDQKC